MPWNLNNSKDTDSEIFSAFLNHRTFQTYAEVRRVRRTPGCPVNVLLQQLLAHGPTPFHEPPLRPSPQYFEAKLRWPNISSENNSVYIYTIPFLPLLSPHNSVNLVVLKCPSCQSNSKIRTLCLQSCSLMLGWVPPGSVGWCGEPSEAAGLFLSD